MHIKRCSEQTLPLSAHANTATSTFGSGFDSFFASVSHWYFGIGFRSHFNFCFGFTLVFCSAFLTEFE